jgi:O-antigen/teichoic acid export membrane protein
VTGIAAIVTAALVAAAPALFAAWLGHPEPDAALALRGLSLAAFAAVAGGVSGAIARGVGRTSIELEWSGLALALHATLGCCSCRGWGWPARSTAITVANLVAALWFAFRLTRDQHWPAGHALWEPFVFPVLAIAAGSAAGAPVAGARCMRRGVALLAASAVAGLVALVVLLATRHVAWGELTRLARRGVAP